MMTPWQALVAAIALAVAVGALGRLVFMRVVIYDYQKVKETSHVQ
jgi:FtsH-binding integral membrane protein